MSKQKNVAPAPQTGLTTAASVQADDATAVTAAAASTPPADVAVRLPVGARPGVQRVGTYVPGTTYRVPIAEALRLVSSKGFEIADEQSAAAVRAFAEQFNAAGQPGAASPAHADEPAGGTSITSQE